VDFVGIHGKRESWDAIINHLTRDEEETNIDAVHVSDKPSPGFLVTNKSSFSEEDLYLQ